MVKHKQKHDSLKTTGPILITERKRPCSSPVLKSVQELQSIADSTIFLSWNVLFRKNDLNWLKPFVLLYDSILLDCLWYDLNPIRMEDTEQNRLILDWLENNALFLSDIAPPPPELNTWLHQIHNHEYSFFLKKQIVTKSGRLDGRFLKAFIRRLGPEKRGDSNWIGSMERLLSFDWPYMEEDEYFASPIFREIFAAWLSSRSCIVGGIPAIVDPLQSWLAERFFRAELSTDRVSSIFKKVLINNIPNFAQLTWEQIFELRQNSRRDKCLGFLKEKARSDVELDNEIRALLWELVAEVAKPKSLKEIALRGILGNIPVPPVNPISIWATIEDFSMAINVERRYSWIMYLADIWEVSEIPNK